MKLVSMIVVLAFAMGATAAGTTAATPAPMGGEKTATAAPVVKKNKKGKTAAAGEMKKEEKH